MASLKYWNGSSWITVPNTQQLKYWDGAQWQFPKKATYWTGATWKTFWAYSDPVTYAFYPDWTQSYTQSYIQTNENIDPGFSTLPDFLAVGFWDTTRGDDGKDWNNVSALLGFKDSVDINGSGLTLAQAVAERPNATALTLRLRAENAYTSKMSFYAGTFTDTGSTLSTWVHTHSSTAYDVSRKHEQTEHTTKTHNIGTTNLLNNFPINKGIVMHGLDGYRNEWRGYWTGRTTPAGNSERPLLTVTLDYV